MRFQYQLSGVNDDWQEAGNRRIAYYTNVAPGSYTFRVRAFNPDGVMSTEEARLDFEIEPRFVQTIWFKALCGLALAARCTCCTCTARASPPGVWRRR
jgi:hypothetical protein